MSIKTPIQVVSTIKFLSERVENASIPGYLSTFQYLEKIPANQTENNDDFINYLAALHFSDCLAVLDAFSAYFQNVIFNAELEKQREGPVVKSLKNKERLGRIW